MLDRISNQMAQMANNRYLVAIRDGLISTLPLIMVGSFFMILAFPPLPEHWPIMDWVAANRGTILLPFRATMFIMTLYAVIGIGSSLAKQYEMDPTSGAIIATVGFMLTLTATTADGLGWVLPMTNLGSQGMFFGIIVAIFSVEVLRFCKSRNLIFKMPDGVPPSVARSFEAIIPTTIVVIAVLHIL